MDTMRATLEIKKVLKIPFIMMSHGEHSKIGRVVCPMLGSLLAFCIQPISPTRISAAASHPGSKSSLGKYRLECHETAGRTALAVDGEASETVRLGFSRPVTDPFKQWENSGKPGEGARCPPFPPLF